MRRYSMLRALVLSISALAFCWSRQTTAMGADVILVGRGDLEIRFDAKTHNLSFVDRGAGVLLDEGDVSAQAGGKRLSSADANVPCRISARQDRAELVLELADALRLSARITSGDAVELTADGTFDGLATFTARAAAGSRGMPAILQDDRPSDQGVLTMLLGTASVPHARSLFVPEKDLAMTADADGGAGWEWTGARQLVARAAAGKMLLALKLHRHYYRDTLGVQYYRPIDKRGYWTTAPIVAMTWYGICGVKQPQGIELLRPEIDWVAKNLLPYAGKLVFQLDDNYNFADDRAMRELSDYIRGKGLIPGVWFTPFSTVPPDQAAAVFQQHPDWFLRNAAGKPLSGFAGRNWGGPLGRGRSYLTNVSQPEALEKLYKPFWHRASETWNYDFFKIDGQPLAAAGYHAAANGGIQDYRRGLEIGRRVVGPEKFINGCSGEKSPLDWIGMVNGSRTGSDTGYKSHAIDVIIRSNFLNNVCWWCDPDAAATLFDKPVDAARINAQARCLTGQQFLTDDYWTKVPEATTRVWQQSYPGLDIFPANLYAIDKAWEDYDLFDLRIAKPWGAWDVVGLFNYSRAAGMKTFDLTRLPLQSDRVHVFEFWSQSYLGRFARDAKITRYLQPNEGQLFAVVPAVDDRPTLISTSRHLSQGGLDLAEVAYRRDGQRWIVRGSSTHLVQGDPYELVFAAGGFQLTEAHGSCETVRASADDSAPRVRITPDSSGSAQWEALFTPRQGAACLVRPETLD